MLAALCLLSLSALLVGAPAVSSAPAPDWPERYLDRESAVELYGMLQNYLMNGGSTPQGGLSRPGVKRNSEMINSLLALQKSMADAGRR